MAQPRTAELIARIAENDPTLTGVDEKCDLVLSLSLIITLSLSLPSFLSPPFSLPLSLYTCMRKNGFSSCTRLSCACSPSGRPSLRPYPFKIRCFFSLSLFLFYLTAVSSSSLPQRQNPLCTALSGHWHCGSEIASRGPEDQHPPIDARVRCFVDVTLALSVTPHTHTTHTHTHTTHTRHAQTSTPTESSLYGNG